MASKKAVVTGVGALALYAGAWPLAHQYDESVERSRLLYETRQQVAELLHEQTTTRGTTIQERVVLPENPTPSDLTVDLPTGIGFVVIRHEGKWCLEAFEESVASTEGRCYEDGEDPAISSGTAPDEDPPEGS